LLKRDIYYSMKSGFTESAFNSYNLMAQCYIQLKNKQLAGFYLDTAQTLMNETLKAVNFKLKFLPTLASYYDLANDYKKAAEVYRTYFTLNDSFFIARKRKRRH